MSKAPGIIIAAMVLTVSMGLSAFTGSCNTSARVVIPHYDIQGVAARQEITPYLNAGYYDCTAVLPVDLESTYNRVYNRSKLDAATTFDGKYFVFKDLLVDSYMIKDVTKGWIWADQIKCPVIDVGEVRGLTIGERIDVVGICEGKDLKQSPTIFFGNCYVLPTGSVQLPAPGAGTVFTPAGY
jgi:hypothetical protein